MSTTNALAPSANADSIRAEWLLRITALVDSVEAWAKEFGWATRRIDTLIEDAEVGNHLAPALLLQENTTRIILQPVGRAEPPTEAYADLYLMPAYDDIARLFFENGSWHLYHEHPGSRAALQPRNGNLKPLTKEAVQEVLNEMLKHASEIV